MRTTLSIDGTWQLWHCQDGEGSAAGLGEVSWLEGSVPGCAHYDLLRQGRIEDPFFEKNTRKLYDLELHEWWYRTTFETPEGFEGDLVELVFEGLDTFATVWMNGVEVGGHSNMFVPVAFDVTALLKRGAANEVVVRLGSPLRAVEGLPMEGCAATMNDPERLWARKIDQCYGWDIAPRIVTAGIWRPAKLVAYRRARIGEDFLRVTELTAEGDAVTAHVVHEVPVEQLADGVGELTVTVHGACGERTFEASAPVVDGVARLEFDVDDAALWWTWDLGEPSLYDLTITLAEAGAKVDRVARKQGLRTVKLVEDDQGEGRVTYVFELNGVRFFARGMNWTPADCYHALGEGGKHDRLLEMSRQMNLNMLRVWGGGIYEPDAWFEKCDELGIMVYQDFMMSCALYPLHPDFLEIMRVEAEAVVRRLRNFACLALWSGDNENDVAYWDWFGERRDVRDNLITRGVLPTAIDAFDGTRDYVPSSPYSPDPTVHPQDKRQGDTHVWHHGTPFEDAVYTQDLSRFVSEIGHLSCPALETMQSFFSPQSLWPNENSVWDHHIGCHEDLDFMPARRKAMDDSIIAYFGEKPKDIETYVLASQICQGEAYKLWTEHYRQRKAGWESAGILLWNVADCWPQISDAVIDYYLRPKLACNYVRWACQPVLVSFLTAPEGGVSVHISNDTLEALSGVCRVTEMLPGGEAGEVVEQMVEVAANGASVALDVTKLASEASARGARLVAELVVGGTTVSLNHLRLSKPTLAEIPLIVADLPAFLGKAIGEIETLLRPATLRAVCFSVSSAGAGRADTRPESTANLTPNTRRQAMEYAISAGETGDGAHLLDDIAGREGLIDPALAHRVAHDVRSPLTAIQMCADMLAREGGDTRSRYVQLIADQARAIGWAMESLVALADSQDGPTEVESCALADVVGRWRDELASMAASRGIQLAVDPVAPAVAVVGDGTHLCAALRGCGEGLITVTQSGGVVGLSVHSEPTAGSVVVGLWASPVGQEIACATEIACWRRLGVLAAQHIVEACGGEIRVHGDGAEQRAGINVHLVACEWNSVVIMS